VANCSVCVIGVRCCILAGQPASTPCTHYLLAVADAKLQSTQLVASCLLKMQNVAVNERHMFYHCAVAPYFFILHMIFPTNVQDDSDGVQAYVTLVTNIRGPIFKTS